MTSDLRTHLFEPLHACDRQRIMAIVELSKLSPSTRASLMQRFGDFAMPLLCQPCFKNLQAQGPCLIGRGHSGTIHGQYEIFALLSSEAGEAVCGWIVSRMPQAELVKHLSQANVVRAPDGRDYLLHYHAENALRILHARLDLQGIAAWLMPIHSWWIPVGHVASNLWTCLSCPDRPEGASAKTLELDPACWAQLAGEPLSFRLADLLASSLAAHGLPPMPYGRRIALVRHLLPLARKEGLSTDDDLTDYVILSSLYGSELTRTRAWQAAIGEARDARGSLALALRSHCAAAGGLS
jgi:hypothetical protein